MKTRVDRGIGRAAAVVLGTAWGFLVAFDVVFFDVRGNAGELASAVLFVLVSYAVLGLAFGSRSAGSSRRWVWWPAGPGVVFVALVLFDSVVRAVYHASVIAAIVAGTSAGVTLGARIREQYIQRDPAPGFGMSTGNRERGPLRS